MKGAHRGAGSRPRGVSSSLTRANTGWDVPGSHACPHPPCPPQVFSIVVFGSIVNEGYINTPSEGKEFCIYNRNPNACSYGVAVGVFAFLTCLLYLALDVYFPQISSVKDRKKAVLSDIGVSGEPPTDTRTAEGCAGPGSINPHADLCEGTDLASQDWQQGGVGPVLA